MKLLPILLLMVSGIARGQILAHVDEIKPDSAYANIYVKKIADNDEQSTFLIWVKTNVKAHYHAEHTESIYVLEGKAIMVVDKVQMEISAGDYISLPKGVHHAVLEVVSRKPLKVVSIQSPHFDGKDRIFVE